MNTGNLLPNGGLTGLLSGSMSVPNSFGMQSTTPASATPTTATASQSSGGLIPPTTPLISSVNPNADAILSAHSATLKSLNTAPPQPLTSAPSSGTSGYSLGYGPGGNAQTTGLGAAQTTVATGAGTPNSLTLAQLAAQQNLVPDPNNPGQYIPASQYSTNGVTPGTLGTGSPSSTAANQSASGMVGNEIGQAQTNVQDVKAQFQPIIDYNTGILNNIQAEEAAISGGSFQGSASDYAGRLGQLESLKQSAQANINAAQTNIQNAINSGQTAFATGIGAATQEVQSPYGTPLLNPMSGTVTSGGAIVGTSGTTNVGGMQLSGVPATDISTLVNTLTSGTGAIGYTQAYNQLSSAYGAAVANQLLPAIQAKDPTFSPSQSDAQAQNVSTTTTTPTTTAAGGYTQAVTNYNSANATYQTVTAQGSTLQQTMASTGINTNPQFVNQPINSLQNQMGSASYTSFAAALTETQQAYETLLGAVGAATPTINGQAATSLLTTSSTPAQINAALQQLQTAAYNKLLPMYNLIGTYQSQLTAPSAPGSTSGTSTPMFGSFNG